MLLPAIPDEPAPVGIDEIVAHTRERLPEGLRMLAGPAQGALLRALTRQTLERLGGSGQVLEIGTFTGYGTRWLIEGLWRNPDEVNYSLASDNQVHTIEVDPRHEPFLRRHWAAYGVAPYVTLHLADGLSLCEAWVAGRLLAGGVGTREAPAHLWANASAWSGEEVGPTGWAGGVELDGPMGPARTALGRFGVIVVDADKRRYSDYLRACRPLLAPGGVMAFDNVLWRGMTRQGDDGGAGAPNARQATHARALRAFLDGVLSDETLEARLLEERDGLLLVRERQRPPV